MTARINLEAADTTDLLAMLFDLASGVAAVTRAPAEGKSKSLTDYADQDLLDELTERMARQNMTVVVRAQRGTKTKTAADKPGADPAEDVGEGGDAVDTPEADPLAPPPDAAAEPAQDAQLIYDEAIQALAVAHKKGGPAKAMVLAARDALGVKKFSDLPVDRGPELLATAKRIQAQHP